MSPLRLELAALLAAYQRTDREIDRQIDEYRDAPCCPSCGSNAGEPPGRSIDALSDKQVRRELRIAWLEQRLGLPASFPRAIDDARRALIAQRERDRDREIQRDLEGLARAE